jgi:hypothetical protein
MRAASAVVQHFSSQISTYRFKTPASPCVVLHHHRAAVASDADEVAGGLVGAFLVLLMIGHSARIWLRLGCARVAPTPPPPPHTHTHKRASALSQHPCDPTVYRSLFLLKINVIAISNLTPTEGMLLTTTGSSNFRCERLTLIPVWPS